MDVCESKLKELPAIFADCCAEEGSGRYSSKVPWISDGWVYATDGRIVVRMPRTRFSPDLIAKIRLASRNRLLPVGSDLDWGESYATNPIELPDPKLPDDQKGPIECAACNGQGEILSVDHESVRICRQCDRTGWAEGDGHSRWFRALACGPVLLSAVFVHLLRRNGIGCVFARDIEDCLGLPVAFVDADGVEGLLMPTSGGDRDQVDADDRVNNSVG